MPANLRKRSEIYANNIHSRGHVKTSLDPKMEQKHEAERLHKKGLGKSVPASVTNSRRLLLGLLVLLLGSALYQVCLPLFGRSSGGRSSRATKDESQLTREQQARAAEAVLRAMNQKAAESYREKAATYVPEDEGTLSILDNIVPENAAKDGGGDDEEEDEEDEKILNMQAPLI